MPKYRKRAIRIAYKISRRHDCQLEYRKLFVIGNGDDSSFQRVSREVFALSVDDEPNVCGFSCLRGHHNGTQFHAPRVEALRRHEFRALSGTQGSASRFRCDYLSFCWCFWPDRRSNGRWSTLGDDAAPCCTWKSNADHHFSPSISPLVTWSDS